MESSTRRNHEAVDEVAVEIRVDERRDALRLMEALIPFHSFLVQHAGDQWIVHARAPGCHGESLEDLLVAIEDWGAQNGVREFSCHLDDPSAAPMELA
jgi:hypothetical protein